MNTSKHILLFFILLSFSIHSYSQDIILFKSGDELKAKVLDIKEDIISYKKWDNIEGPTYTTSKDKVFMVKYINGTKDVFSAEQPISNNSITDENKELNAFQADKRRRALNTISNTSENKNIDPQTEILKLEKLKRHYINGGIGCSILGPLILAGGVALIQYDPLLFPDGSNLGIYAGGAVSLFSLFIISRIPIAFVKAGRCSSKINKLNSNVKISPTLINNYAIGKVNPTLGLNISVSF
jgi:hypothetical protein